MQLAVQSRLECRCALRASGGGTTSRRPARVFWDLDNIKAANAEHALVMGHRLKAAVQRVTGLRPSLSAFANEYTVDCLRNASSSEAWEAVLELLQADLAVAPLEKDAADLLMQREMIKFAAEHGPAAAVVCVSNDKGFAPALEDCSRRGALTIAVGCYALKSGKVPLWERRLPAAANCIVAFAPSRAAQHSKTERSLVTSWRQRLQSAEAAALAKRAKILGAAKESKGVCCSNLLNPNRPLPPELKRIYKSTWVASQAKAVASAADS